MNSFNKTEAAVFSCRLCFLKAFPQYNYTIHKEKYWTSLSSFNQPEESPWSLWPARRRLSSCEVREWRYGAGADTAGSWGCGPRPGEEPSQAAKPGRSRSPAIMDIVWEPEGFYYIAGKLRNEIVPSLLSHKVPKLEKCLISHDIQRTHHGQGANNIPHRGHQHFEGAEVPNTNGMLITTWPQICSQHRRDSTNISQWCPI